MSELDLRQPRRQSIVGVGVIFIKNLRIAINVFISVVVVQFGLNFSIFGLGMKGIGVVLALIFLLISYLQYRRFFFYVQNEKFIIEKGLISRDKITIPFDRIQTVNISQNLFQRILGVVAVKVDTAGSAQKELEISALSNTYARELQHYLIQRKQEMSATTAGESSAEIDEDRPVEEGKAQTNDLDFTDRKPLVHLNVKQLMLVGLTENHLRTGIVLFAVLNGYIWQYEEYLLKPFEPYIQEQADEVMASWLVLLPIAVVGFLVISVLISMIQAVLRYTDLYFFVDKKGVQLVSGLLKRTEYQIPVNKMQYLKWKTNPLRQLIGLQTVVIKQASSEEVGDRQSIKIPGCQQEQIRVLLDTFYPECRSGGFYLYRAHKLLFMQRATWLGLLPALALCGLAFFHPLLLIIPAFYLPLSLFFTYKYYRSVGLAVNSEILILKKGWVSKSKLALQFYKLQDISFSQSIFQKKRDLASITFFTAAGDETMPHIPASEALQIYNYCLYKIETSAKSWM